MLTPTKTISCAALIFALSGSITALAQAQTVPGLKTADLSPAETEWKNLEKAADNLNRENAGAAQQPGAKASASERAAKATRLADQAKDFYSKNPGHPKALEARSMEAHQLIEAVDFGGDDTVRKRMEVTVDKMRKDQTVPVQMRVVIAGAHDFSTSIRQCTKTEQVTLALEKVARGLMAEFPDQPQGYESLLTVARERDEPQAKALARELLRSSASAFVKEGAQTLLDQFALIGRDLGGVLKQAGAKAMQSGKPTVIYSWAGWSPNSLTLAAFLSSKNLTGINLIAVNLDQDVAAAKKIAGDRSLPGLMNFDPLGPKGPLAAALKFNGAPQVYVTDAQGVIRDVRGLDNLDQKLQQLGL